MASQKSSAISSQNKNQPSQPHPPAHQAPLPQTLLPTHLAKRPSYLLNRHHPDLSRSLVSIPSTSSAVPSIVQPLLISPRLTFSHSQKSSSSRPFSSTIRSDLPQISPPFCGLNSECTSHSSRLPSSRLSKIPQDSPSLAFISGITSQICTLSPLEQDCRIRNCTPKPSPGRSLHSSQSFLSRRSFLPVSKRFRQFYKSGLSNHRQPYFNLDEPFSLEITPELISPTSPIFPCVPQEADPNSLLTHPELQPTDPSEPKMACPRTVTSSNHNLIGHRIDRGRLELMSVLGLGAYGVVYLARDLTSPDMQYPKLYAVKALNKVGLDARQKCFQRREIALHSLASSHPSIVTLHAVIEAPSCIFVILDYCPDGDLFGMITEKQKYLGETDAIKSVFIQIVDAVQFCHGLGIGHRDLKPENILCKKGGSEVVLADFGLATAEKTSSDFGCGSTFYMSPECQGGLYERLDSYSTVPNDIWSLGVILVNLSCGRNPWKQACNTDETFRAYLANPDFLRSILPISESCNSLLKRIFAIDPLGRISLDELKEEILRIETFNMTTAELGKASKATRDAARTWLKDLTANTKTQNTNVDFASWKDFLSKKTKQLKPCESKAVEASVVRCSSSRHQVWKPQTVNPVVSNHLSQPVISSSIYSLDNGKPGLNQLRPVSPSTPSRPLGLVALQDSLPADVPDTPSPHVDISPRPMIASWKYLYASSTSSREHAHCPLGFSRRLRKFSHAASTLSQSSHQEPHFITSCKKFLPKPLTFHRPNAPRPIIVEPYAIVNPTQPTVGSHLEGLITPRLNDWMPPIPCTPPFSGLPAKTAFGFIKKHSRFLPSTGHSNNELPPTPLSPKQATGVCMTPSPSGGSAIRYIQSGRCRKMVPRSPLSINHQGKSRANSVTSHFSGDDVSGILDDTPVE